MSNDLDALLSTPLEEPVDLCCLVRQRLQGQGAQLLPLVVAKGRAAAGKALEGVVLTLLNRATACRGDVHE